MEDFRQKKNDIITKIEVINEKLLKIDDENSMADRNQISLIINNLLQSLKNCDEKLLLKQIIETLDSTISSIDSNITNKQYSVNQPYLYELIKIISYLNNANGKQNLQGYQQAVNKNISLLEKDIDQSIIKLNELKQSVINETKNFKESEKNIENSILNNKKEYETQLKEISQKYEHFISDYAKKQIDFQNNLVENQNNFKTEYNQEIINLKEEISATKTEFKEKVSKSIADFDSDKTKKLETLSNDILEMIKTTETELNQLKDSAAEKIGFVASATYSNTYKEYSDKARRDGIWWYIGTIFSMLVLVGLSIWWFVATKYTNTDYIALIAKVFATIGIAVIARYCAIQASKCKVIETKLRKIQLQMATFNAFVASLEKDVQDKLKLELTQKLINQKDWIVHDKNEVDILKEFEKILKKYGYVNEKTKTENKTDD